MYDIVFPDNNEKEFIKIAEKINYKGLFFIYPFNTFQEYKHKSPIKIYSGVLCTKEEEIRKARKISNLIVWKQTQSNRESSMQHILEKFPPDILFELEKHTQKDFMHHKNSALNHVLVKLMAKNDVGYAISWSMLLHNLSDTLGRVEQNILLYKKARAKLVIASFTSNPYELRSSNDLSAFFEQLELHPSVIKQAFNEFLNVYNKNLNKKSKNYIREGVEIVE